MQVHSNFEIGRRIVEEEQRGEDRAAYGQEIIRTLAERLTEEFGRGFSTSSLAYMRTFYLTYQDRLPIFQTLSGKSAGPHARPCSLGWSHYVFLTGISNPDERSFYEIESREQNWTVRELKHQYNASLYERLAQQGQLVEKPADLMKEPLVLEFLGLDERTHYSESDLETAIIGQIEAFLLEVGKGYLFEARRKRFSFDLVLYYRLLRCYILLDLKLGKLTMWGGLQAARDFSPAPPLTASPAA